ncbi:MAG: hypothetical protein QJR13_05085 [Bacillota bacterium]|nr:hypothetical protein [Bacillota bacterium]
MVQAEVRVQARSSTLWGYNPLDGWYLGLGATLQDLGVKNNAFDLMTKYGFSSQKTRYLLRYTHHVGNWCLSAQHWQMVTFAGVYAEGTESGLPSYPLWELETGASAWARYRWGEHHLVELSLSTVDFAPAVYGGSLPFVAGRSDGATLKWVASYPGFYSALSWHRDFPGGGDYDYQRSLGRVIKVFPEGHNRFFTLYASAGAISGRYPLQQAFFLGDSRLNLDEHFWDKLAGAVNNLGLGKEVPLVGDYLRGYPDGFLRGDRMYLLTVEQSTQLWPPAGRFHPFPVAAEVLSFLDLGNAWYEGQGSGEPKVAAGLGFRLHLNPKQTFPPLPQGEEAPGFPPETKQQPIITIQADRPAEPPVEPLPPDEAEQPDPLAAELPNLGFLLSADLARGLSPGGVWRLGLSLGISTRF